MTHQTIQKKRVTIVALVIISLLLIPLLAMQFTNEVNWTLFDFVVAGILLTVLGLAFELFVFRVKKTKHMIIIGAVLLIVFFLIWTELAVGIFGTPFGGQ